MLLRVSQNIGQNRDFFDIHTSPNSVVEDTCLNVDECLLGQRDETRRLRKAPWTLVSRRLFQGWHIWEVWRGVTQKMDIELSTVSNPDPSCTYSPWNKRNIRQASRIKWAGRPYLRGFASWNPYLLLPYWPFASRPQRWIVLPVISKEWVCCFSVSKIAHSPEVHLNCVFMCMCVRVFTARPITESRRVGTLSQTALIIHT